MLDIKNLYPEIAATMNHGAKRLNTPKGTTNPWLKFSPEKVDKLVSLLRLNNGKDVIRFCQAIGRIAEWFYLKEQMVDLELTPKVRKGWLETNINQPAQKLIEALGSNNDKMFIEVYEDFDQEFIGMLKGKPIVKKMVRIGSREKTFAQLDLSTRDFNQGALHERLLLDLTALNAWTIRKVYSLGKKKKRNWNKTRHKEEVVSALLKVYIFFCVRSTSGNASKVKRPSLTKGEFALFVRQAAMPILGRYDNLSDQIKKASASYKKMGNKTSLKPNFFPTAWFGEVS